MFSRGLWSVYDVENDCLRWYSKQLEAASTLSSLSLQQWETIHTSNRDMAFKNFDERTRKLKKKGLYEARENLNRRINNEYSRALDIYGTKQMISATKESLQTSKLQNIKLNTTLMQLSTISEKQDQCISNNHDQIKNLSESVINTQENNMIVNDNMKKMQLEIDALFAESKKLDEINARAERHIEYEQKEIAELKKYLTEKEEKMKTKKSWRPWYCDRKDYEDNNESASSRNQHDYGDYSRNACQTTLNTSTSRENFPPFEQMKYFDSMSSKEYVDHAGRGPSHPSTSLTSPPCTSTHDKWRTTMDQEIPREAMTPCKTPLTLADSCNNRDLTVDNNCSRKLPDSMINNATVHKPTKYKAQDEKNLIDFDSKFSPVKFPVEYESKNNLTDTSSLNSVPSYSHVDTPSWGTDNKNQPFEEKSRFDSPVNAKKAFYFGNQEFENERLSLNTNSIESQLEKSNIESDTDINTQNNENIPPREINSSVDTCASSLDNQTGELITPEINATYYQDTFCIVSPESSYHSDSIDETNSGVENIDTGLYTLLSALKKNFQ